MNTLYRYERTTHTHPSMYQVYADVFVQNMLTTGAILKSRAQAWIYWTKRINGVPSGLVHAMASALGVVILPPKRSVQRSSREVTVSLLGKDDAPSLGERKTLSLSPRHSPLPLHSGRGSGSALMPGRLSPSPRYLSPSPPYSSSSSAVLRSERLRRASSNPASLQAQLEARLVGRGHITQTILEHEVNEDDSGSGGNDTLTSHSGRQRTRSLTDGDEPFAAPGSPESRIKMARRMTRSATQGAKHRSVRHSFLDLIDRGPVENGGIDVGLFLKSGLGVRGFKAAMEEYILSKEELLVKEREKKLTQFTSTMAPKRVSVVKHTKRVASKSAARSRNEHAIDAMSDMYRNLQAYRKLLGVASIINSDSEERKALQNITSSVHQIVHCERVTFFFVDHERKQLRIDFHETDPGECVCVCVCV
jgi:hypothetical protein